MNNDRKQVMTIFSEALEKSSREALNHYLDEVCKDDAELRAEVESLLRAHDNAGQFLDGCPAHAGKSPIETVDESVREQPGTLIGPYKLLQQLGAGGMGVVYLAWQTEPIERQVAIKIIRLGMDSKQVLARFEAEKQALALMDHPNIAKVLDGGTTDTGRPYFVMELVKGVSITKYCDEHHLTPKQRLELFRPICHAVQHAHQKGIIHRDLKPSNILVALYDGRPVPKVIDFGVAKATGGKLTNRTLFTEVGSIVGTLEYMSPEQAELNNLDIDTRSDVYSLGVLLYELLTGTTPLEHKLVKEMGLMELLRRIREEETPRPSLRLSTAQELPQIAAARSIDPKKLSFLLRGELDWILSKALEKDRHRRYETATAFGQDIERYLHDEPVTACPPSTWYRFRKFAWRNRQILITAAVAVLLLLVATTVSLWQADRATRAKVDAEKAQKNEAQQRQKADDNLKLAKDNLKFTHQLLDRMYLRVVEKELIRHPERLEEYREVLKEALDFYVTLAKRNADDPEAKYQKAIAYRRAGSIHRLFEDYQAALRYLQLARTEFADLIGKHPHHLLCQKHHIEVLRQTADVLARQWKFQEAIRTAQEALDAAEKISTPTRPPGYFWLLNDVLNVQGDAYLLSRQYEAAEIVYRKAIANSLEWKAQGENAESRKAYVKSYGNLAYALMGLNKFEDAEKAIRRGFPELEKLRTKETWWAALASEHYQTYYFVLEYLNRKDEAREYHKKAADLTKKLSPTRSGWFDSKLLGLWVNNRRGPTMPKEKHNQSLRNAHKLVKKFPQNPTYRRQLASVHTTYGLALELKNQLQAAKKQYNEGLKVIRALRQEYGNNAPWVVDREFMLLCNLSYAQNKLNEHKEVEKTLNLAMKLSEKLPTPYDRAHAKARIAHQWREFGDFRKAADVLKKAIPLLRKLYDERTSDLFAYELVFHHNSLGGYFLRLQEHSNALRSFEQSNKLLKILNSKRPQKVLYIVDLASLAFNRGITFSRLRKHDKSIECLHQAIQLQRLLVKKASAAPNQKDRFLQFAVEYADALIRGGKSNKLPEITSEGIEVGEALVKEGHANTDAKERLASLCSYRGTSFAREQDHKKASRYRRRAVELQREVVKESPTPVRKGLLLRCLREYARSLSDTKNYGELEKITAEGIPLAEKLIKDGHADADKKDELAALCYYRSVTYMAKRDYDKGYQSILRTVELCEGLYKTNPRAFQSRLNAAHLKLIHAASNLSEKRHLEAIHRARNVMPEDPSYRLEFAWFLANCQDKKQRNPKQALEHIKKVLKVAPNNPLCLAAKGAIEYRLGNSEEAVKILQSVVKTPRPQAFESTRDRFFLACALGKLKRTGEAAKEYDQANKWLQAKRGSLDVYLVGTLDRLKAECDDILGIKIGDNTDALLKLVEFQQQVVKKSPSSLKEKLRLLELVARCSSSLARAGRFEKPTQQITSQGIVLGEELIKKKVAGPKEKYLSELYNVKANFCGRTGDHMGSYKAALRSVELFEELYAKHKDQKELQEVLDGLYGMLCFTAGNTGDEKLQLQAHERALKVMPESPTFHNDLASCLLMYKDEEKRDLKRAHKLIQFALKKDPKNLSYRGTLGLALYRLGKYEQAKKTMQAVIAEYTKTHKPDYGLACNRFQLALALEKCKQSPEARKQYELAVEWLKGNRRVLFPTLVVTLERLKGECDQVFETNKRKDSQQN